jgi:hypothetical protein
LASRGIWGSVELTGRVKPMVSMGVTLFLIGQNAYYVDLVSVRVILGLLFNLFAVCTP